MRRGCVRAYGQSNGQCIKPYNTDHFDNLDKPLITICDNTCKAQLSENLVVWHEMVFGVWRNTKT